MIGRFVRGFLVFLLLIATLLAGVFVWYQQNVLPVTSRTQAQAQTQTVIVPKGKGISWIANLLSEKKLIRSPLVFRIETWRLGIASKIQAGTFKLSSAQSTTELAQDLTKGTEDVWVTALEGWRAEEFAAAFHQALGNSFDSQKFLELAKPQEGYLFPDTYLVPKSATATQVFTLLTNTFRSKLPADWEAQVRAGGRTPEQAVIMASLLQREAKTHPTMRMVAGILWKRVDIGWPLQVDATLQYIKGYDAKAQTWWSPPLAADKSLVSPFNTYTHTGLPPAPISNPSLDALRAVADPQASEYWYYLSDAQGNMHYAKTLEEHNANVQKYLW